MVIHVNALEAALANLNITDISAAQLITAVKKEEKNLSISRPESERKCLSFILCKLHLCNGLCIVPKIHCSQDPGSFPPYESTFTMEPVENDERVRLLKLRDLVRKDFPGGT